MAKEKDKRLKKSPLGWIRDTEKEKEKEAKSRTPEGKESKTSEVQKRETSEVPKYQTFDVKLSVLLREDQLKFLEDFTREIMKNREEKRERITKNTIIRASIDTLRALKINIENIPDEKTLRQRIKEKLKKF